jgi:rhodanese-related sulfurtransferase
VVEAKRLIDEGGAVVIDVRDFDDYVAGHIPGSLQIPLGYVQGEIPWFPQDKKLITYCT